MKEGWTYKKLGEVCDFQGGSQPPKNEWSKEPKIGYVRMLQIRDFTQNATDYIEYVKESKSLKYCNEDDILIGRYGASVGKILSGLSGAYNVAIIKTIPRDIVNKNYIKYYFLSPYFQHNLLIVSQHRAAQAGFSKDDIVDFQIPCPPFAEQERIVAELDLLSSIIEKKKAQLKELDQLAQSIFYDMFGDPITNEKAWVVKKMGEIGELQRGSGLSKKDLIENGFPCILYGQIHTKFGAYTKKHIACIPQDLVRTAKIAHFGDVIMAITSEDVEGSCKSVAWMGDYDIAIGSDAAIYRHNINGIYVSYYTQTKAFYFEKAKYANGFKVTHISTKEIATIPIPLPPLPLQQEFADKVEAIERQKSLIQQSIVETQTLFDSRMDYWFG